MNLHELELKSWDLRRYVVDIIMAGGGGHIGGDMSVLNTLLVLYKIICASRRRQPPTPTVTALC